MKELEKQNLMLKELLKQETENFQKNKREGLTMSTDLGPKEGNSKFEITNSISKIAYKARTFDQSMEISFDELELGKQIS